MALRHATSPTLLRSNEGRSAGTRIRASYLRISHQGAANMNTHSRGSRWSSVTAVGRVAMTEDGSQRTETGIPASLRAPIK
jgi:hypothetical protein